MRQSCALYTPPSVAIVVPARNEADTHRAERHLAAAAGLSGVRARAGRRQQRRRHRRGGARAPPRRSARSEKLTIVPGAPLPEDWTGKLWAVKQGIEAAEKQLAPKYLMLTDADIVHEPDTLRWLVAHAEAEQLVLTSLTARWRCESLAERVHIPAFIFFFQMLYPFAWVNRPDHPMAGAAGGCMLVRADALRAAGGIDDHSRRADRRLRARARDEEAGADLARPHRSRAQHPPLSEAGAISAAWWRARPMRSSLLAAAARRHRRGPRADLSGSTAHGAVRVRLGAGVRRRQPGR